MFKLSILFTVFGAVNSLCTEDSVYLTGVDEAFNEEVLFDGCYTSTAPIILHTGTTLLYTRDGLEKDGLFIHKTGHSIPNWVVSEFIYDSNTEDYYFDSDRELTIISIYSNGGRGSPPENPADATDWEDSSSRWFQEDINVENIDILCGCGGETPSPTVEESSPTPSPTVEESSPTPSPTVEESPPTPSPTVEESSPPTPSPTVEESSPTPNPTVEESSPTPSPTVEESPPTPSPTVEPTVDSDSKSSTSIITIAIAIIAPIVLVSLILGFVIGRKCKKHVEDDGADGANYPVDVEDGNNYPVMVEDGKNYPVGVMCVQGYPVEPSCPPV